MSDALSRGGWLLGRETGVGLEGPHSNGMDGCLGGTWV
jgi:hypothetical protein